MRVGRLITVPVIAAALALSACGSSGERTYNVSGTVIDKQTGEDCKTEKKHGRWTTQCTPEYEISLRDVEDDVDVTKDHYDRCETGDRFPSCAENSQ